MYKDIKLFKACCILLCISSLAIMLSFFGDYNGNIFNVIIAYAVGVLFWGGIIAGYCIFAIIASHRKKKLKKENEGKRRAKAGIISFFSNKYAKVFDLAMVLLFIIILAFMFIPISNQGITIVFISIFIFSVHMHCILNGVNFKYIQSLKERGE